jgi:hypothetical protein
VTLVAEGGRGRQWTVEVRRAASSGRAAGNGQRNGQRTMGNGAVFEVLGSGWGKAEFSGRVKRSRRQERLEENAETPKLDQVARAALDAERARARARRRGEFATTLGRSSGSGGLSRYLAQQRLACRRSLLEGGAKCNRVGASGRAAQRAGGDWLRWCAGRRAAPARLPLPCHWHEIRANPRLAADGQGHLSRAGLASSMPPPPRLGPCWEPPDARTELERPPLAACQPVSGGEEPSADDGGARGLLAKPMRRAGVLVAPAHDSRGRKAQTERILVGDR